MSDPAKPTLPTVHMNGTGLRDLKQGYDEAAEALEDFITKWGQIEFNARDYYVQAPEAYTTAREEREEQSRKIRDLKNYLHAIRLHLHNH